MNDVGRQILYKRNALGWTRRQVADFLGVASEVTVARYETGKCIPQRKYMVKVHDFLRLPILGNTLDVQHSMSTVPTPSTASVSGMRRALGSRVNLPAVIVSQDLEQKIRILSTRDRTFVAALVDRLLMNS